jgi:hypothetical protein
MAISGFLIRVIFLAVPGIVSYMLFRKLAGKTKCEKWEELCQVVLFSLIIYVTYSIFISFFGLFGWSKKELTFFKAIIDEKVTIEWSEIIIASLLGVPIAFIALAIHTYKLLNRIGRLIRVTKRFGDEDVWDYFNNLPDIPEYEWVFVRDHKTGLVYFGWIYAYSDSEKDRELLMCDVDVYTNDNGEFLYTTGMLYLCRDRYDLTIEMRVTSENNQEKVQD